MLIAKAESAAVEHMMVIATCSLRSVMKGSIYSDDSLNKHHLLNGPWFINLGMMN
jgi:hypothetical protein